MEAERRIAALRTRHVTIDRRISEEEKFCLVDDLLVMRLKKEKLRLKDEIFKLEKEFPQT